MELKEIQEVEKHYKILKEAEDAKRVLDNSLHSDILFTSKDYDYDRKGFVVVSSGTWSVSLRIVGGCLDIKIGGISFLSTLEGIYNFIRENYEATGNSETAYLRKFRYYIDRLKTNNKK